MRVLIVGAGAVGGYFGAGLIEAGRDVTFLVRERRADALRREGLRVAVGDTVTVHEHPQTVTAADAASVGPFDAVVLSVKAFALDAAIDDITPFVGPDTMVLPLLNGMRHLDRLQDAFGERVLGGLCVVAAQLEEGGVIRRLAPGASLTLGELSGGESERTTALAAELVGQGFDTRLASDVRAMMWQKWVFLASGGAVTSLHDGAVGEIVATPTGALSALRLIDEVAAIAAAEGYPPTARALETVQSALTEPGSSFTTSLFRDLRQGLPVENEHILGDLVERAVRRGIDTPLLAAAYARIRVYENRR
ncbi:ketopantoate reductase family protein [Cnuibacter physcomitrellae]|uniref:ketopantoate reductase family protein n=1 Tax=Cnuibacter physcomitrellae TaxID=1619308 RepID=UPI002175725C|nr:ketopantoate reductase family protein [Cnuibacter physcomitrellae]MCS5495925.1 ketopantoate reductase family protein [Cnuibacter physcomitrellae]